MTIVIPIDTGHFRVLMSRLLLAYKSFYETNIQSMPCCIIHIHQLHFQQNYQLLEIAGYATKKI